MEKLSVNEIIQRIKNYDCFECISEDGSFQLKIRDYVPFICAAIHAGHNLCNSFSTIPNSSGAILHYHSIIEPVKYEVYSMQYVVCSM